MGLSQTSCVGPIAADWWSRATGRSGSRVLTVARTPGLDQRAIGDQRAKPRNPSASPQANPAEHACPVRIGRRLDSLCAAAVRLRDDLEIVAARIFEIRASTAIVRIDLTLPAVRGIRPVGQSAALYSRKNAIELGLAHQKRVVFRPRLMIIAGEVQRDAVIQLHGKERPERLRLGKSE